MCVCVCVCLQREVDAAKPVPVLNSSLVDGPAGPRGGLSGPALDDTEMRKLLEECKRLQAEMSKLSEENRHLKVRESVKDIYLHLHTHTHTHTHSH